MKRRLAVALVAVAALSASLAGCSGTSAPTGKPSLLLWVDTPRVPQANEYKKEMAGKVDIKVEVISQADAQTKVALHNRTKSGWPDVIFGTAADTAAFLDPSNGYAADLGNTVSKKIVDGFGAANSDCVFDGKTYCLKNDLANIVLWYNTKIFKELNLTVPTTMQEFADTAMKLKGTGYSAGAYGDQGFYASFMQSSECPMAEITKPNVVRIAPNDPKCTRVAKLVQPLMDAGVIDKRSAFDASFLADTAQKDKVAMQLGPSWFGDFVLKPAASWNLPAGEIAAANFPTWGSGSDDKTGAWGGGVFTVSSHSKFPQAAADAAVWLTTSDWVANASTTPTFPAYGPANKLWAKQVAADTWFASDPYPAMAQGSLKISQVDRPVRFAFVAQIGAVIQTEIGAGKPLQTVIDDFATSVQKLAPLSAYTVVAK